MNSIIFEKQNTLVEQRSRFVAYIFKCETVQKQANLLKFLRKEHPSCSHICYASVIDDGIIVKYSTDDREPSGTAGAQIAMLLEKYSLINVFCAVVRYFGGVKLGVSGLSKAYKECAEGCIENNCKVVELKNLYKATCSYPEFDKIKAFSTKNSFALQNQVFSEFVTFEVFLSNEEFQKLSTFGGKFEKTNKQIYE